MLQIGVLTRLTVQGKALQDIMPLIVDHDERRAQVARIAIDLILRDGVEGVSVRAIARAAGYSTAIVSHYFHTKADLLLLAYRTRLTQADARVEAALAAGADMLTTLGYLLPLDQDGRDNWKIWFAFWGMALAHADFQREQIAQGRAAQSLIAQVLANHGKRADDMAAGRVLAMIAGLATQATYDPDAWPPERQRAILAAEIAAIGTA